MPSELCATYRLQLRPGFGFDAAADVADYLAELGISHVYCSAYLQAAPGSTHGYDVVDPTRVNEELGGSEAHARFCTTLGRLGVGQVLDVVPNHMAVGGRENAWWWDVLENGPSSRYATYFDVDWDPPEARLRNMVLLPILGDQYGRVLEASEIRLDHSAGRFTVHYHEHVFPVAPRSLAEILRPAAQRCGSDLLGFLADAYGRLPRPTTTDLLRVQQRHRDKAVLTAQLTGLCQQEPAVGAAIDAVVTEFNADPDRLHEFLERQNHRLAFWRTVEQDLGYRRFFDINSLVGLRAEDERVFADTHGLILKWLADGVLDGLRIDHPDGLRDPEGYLRRIQHAAPRAWIVVEKILQPGEELSRSWPVAGTTGYDFLNRVGGLFIDPAGEQPLTDFYVEFTGQSADYAALVREKKRRILSDVLGGDLNRLTALFLRICERHRRYRDYTRHQLHEVLSEVCVCLPVYRTYVRATTGTVGEADLRYITESINEAKQLRPDIDGELFDFFRDLLLLRVGDELERELVMRFQQFTGPVMAKGAEDTAFYGFNRLISLNEVGGHPGRFGVTVDEFHAACRAAQTGWPLGMLATSTHDTKRSEDVRARISLLSEIPLRWAEAVRQWAALNARHRTNDLPDRNAEYLLYQTLVGAWPLEVGRATAFMEKAAREAKVHTSWSSPEPVYEDALRSFTEAVMDEPEFTGALGAFVDPLATPGRISSLSQTLLKLTAPGVPDLYQGSELWDLSLVDPDNRRPVDFALRRRLLRGLETATPEDVWQRIDEGLPKLWVIRRTLALRRRRPDLFGPSGSYRPLSAEGPKARHVVAFMRGGAAVTIVPRLLMGLGDDWPLTGGTSVKGWVDTVLEVPAGKWRNEMTEDAVRGGRQRLADVLRRFPVALLSRQEKGE
jgi:(1->4)-alpha-D-glucan 1-alpha-D-glucosylmutase